MMLGFTVSGAFVCMYRLRHRVYLPVLYNLRSMNLLAYLLGGDRQDTLLHHCFFQVFLRFVKVKAAFASSYDVALFALSTFLINLLTFATINCLCGSVALVGIVFFFGGS